MKEKLKNIFKNKNLWSTIVEILCSILLVCVGYFSGFAAGLLVDDSIRTELIDINLIETKNEKIDINKKEVVSPQYFTTEIVLDNIIATGSIDNSIFTAVNNVHYTFVYEINENNISFYDIKVQIFTNILLYDYSLGIPVYDSAETIFTSSTLTLEKTNNLYFDFSSIDVLSVSLPLITYEPNVDDVFLCTFFKLNNNIIYYNSYNNGLFVIQSVLTSFDNWINSLSYNSFSYSFLESNNYYDSTTSYFYSLNSAFNTNILNYYNDISYNTGYNTGYDIGYEQGLENGGFSGEDLQNAYDSGFQYGKSEGYQEGYQDRKDSVEDTENRINSIWTILEKAITSVLNVLSMEILPGIPLFICIVVPVLLGVILWVIKMGGS